MTSAFEQSFKKRLQMIAKERNRTPAEVWQNVIHERFLARLCRSSHRDHFILKGGVLLAKHIDIGRETKDLDFSVRNIESEINQLDRVMNGIVSLDLGDGFTFRDIQTETLEHFHMEYTGARIKMQACLGKARLPLFIDLGFGDLVPIKEEKIMLLASKKGALFEENVHLPCYPIEFIFAEKLETIVFRGRENSRMKDYHDLYSMTRKSVSLNKSEVTQAIDAIFQHRRTPLAIPIRFDAPALSSLQHYWHRYRQTAMVPDQLPTSIDHVIEAINKWLESKRNDDV
jgi:predicted nucleotidyltransferase component of viral defense system